MLPLAAKSKSMVTEEIGLNRALESAGVRVVETDLGEYILQLAGEHPVHIIAPAIEKTADDVAELLGRAGGAPVPPELEALTLEARRQLRETFLHADVGITGANFGVSETGTVCLVTNEGNGRLVSSLPPVHIVADGDRAARRRSRRPVRPVAPAAAERDRAEALDVHDPDHGAPAAGRAATGRRSCTS